MATKPTPRIRYTHDAIDSAFTEHHPTPRRKPPTPPALYVLGGAVAGWLANDLVAAHIIAEFLGL
jgi:hypothetical protein